MAASSSSSSLCPWFPGFAGFAWLGVAAAVLLGTAAWARCGGRRRASSGGGTQTAKRHPSRGSRLSNPQHPASRTSVVALASSGVLCAAVLFTVYRVLAFPPADNRASTLATPPSPLPLPAGGGAEAACLCRSFACLRAAFGATTIGAATPPPISSGARDHKPAAFGVPHFWLGGGQKCGTTTMYELLARHPGIVAPEPKEPGYFAWPGVARRVAERWYLGDVLRLEEACRRGLDRAATFDATAYYLQWGKRVFEYQTTISASLFVTMMMMIRVILAEKSDKVKTFVSRTVT